MRIEHPYEASDTKLMHIVTKNALQKNQTQKMAKTKIAHVHLNFSNDWLYATLPTYSREAHQVRKKYAENRQQQSALNFFRWQLPIQAIKKTRMESGWGGVQWTYWCRFEKPDSKVELGAVRSTHLFALTHLQTF